MKKLSDKIVNKIKEEKIKPKAKWVFLLKDYFIWSAFGVSIIIGGLAFVVILFLLTTNDWDMHKYLGEGFGVYFLTALPRVWIGTLILFLLVAYYNYRHTKGGYRYKAYLIVLGSVVTSVVIGTALFFMGLGDKIEQSFANTLPYYGGYMEHRMEIWNQPEKGLLAGEIIEIKSENILMIEDFKKNIWEIDVNNALWRGGQVAKIGNKVKIIGVKKSNNIFTAQEIRPWVGREGRHGNGGHYRNGKGYGGRRILKEKF